MLMAKRATDGLIPALQPIGLCPTSNCILWLVTLLDGAVLDKHSVSPCWVISYICAVRRGGGVFPYILIYYRLGLACSSARLEKELVVRISQYSIFIEI
jgi:hypothetical protein